MSDIVLLGPQGDAPAVDAVLEKLRHVGSVCLVTAGWQEREGELQPLRERLGRAVSDLALYARADDVFAADPSLFHAHRERQDRLKQLQRYYRMRLSHTLAAARELLGAADGSPLYDAECRAAIGALRTLDRHHLRQIRKVHADFQRRLVNEAHPALERARQAVAEALTPGAAVLIAGGHVAVLATRLRLFDCQLLFAGHTLVAWSAGAMAICDRIVLFHDHPPQGPGDAEILDAGLGLVPRLVALPDASERLALDDVDRVSLFARRFAPALCATLERDSALHWNGRGIDRASGVGQLTSGGRVLELRGTVRSPLDVLRRSKRRDAAAVDQFIADHRFPLVDETGVTFVYRGAADEVRLKHWVYGLPSDQPLERLTGTDLWYLHLELPQNSRVEYKFDVIRNRDNNWILDPLNPRVAADPFGANSVCPAYGYRQPEWTLPDPNALPGSVDRLEVHSRAFGGVRQVQVYVPPRFRRTRRYGLLIVHDGGDFERYGSLGTVLDNLIHRLEVSPLVVALTQPVDRLHEYAADTRHARFLSDELVPALAHRLPLIDAPESRALLGASFGAVASLHAAWRKPGFYGALMLLSGSFAFTDIGRHQRGSSFDPVVRFVNAFRRRPGRPVDRVYVSCGIYESLIYENRSLVPLLQKHGMQVRFREVRDGHNWENWRDRMQDGLSWVYPGPLWMVYE